MFWKYKVILLTALFCICLGIPVHAQKVIANLSITELKRYNVDINFSGSIPKEALDSSVVSYNESTKDLSLVIPGFIQLRVYATSVTPDGGTIGYGTSYGSMSRIRLIDMPTSSDKTAEVVRVGHLLEGFKTVTWYTNDSRLVFVDSISPTVDADMLANIATGLVMIFK